MLYEQSRIDAEATVTLDSKPCVDVFVTGREMDGGGELSLSLRPIEAERLALALCKAARAARAKVSK